MKNLLSILLCLFAISINTTWAQYRASISTDVNRAEVTDDPNIDTKIYFDSGLNVELTAIATTQVMKYQGTGTLKASLWAAFMQKKVISGRIYYLTACADLSLTSYKSETQTGFTSATDTRNVSAAFMEYADLKATSTGSTEGYATATIRLTW